ncbi:MCE family protein [Aldersonia sp. NBC_00410]|uniref:MCE family protein n=1 Tax=Aldersonia sp. NBC_00410 TaxID=2975954 RepID=UPI002256E3B4|nr:MCE family protein [Aldersonia sp. NBC_00410]MCX5043361.1 MCE family protein [Aldersonia sp. NBC_00410]
MVATAVVFATAGCEWTGLNSLPLPGAEGTGAGAYEVMIQMPNVTTLTQNSPVRVNDVTVGSVSKIEVQDWHALVTVKLDGDVALPANTTAKIGQTSLLGSNHVELAAPVDQPAEGTLEPGDTIPLERASVFPTTEQTLSSLSVVLNGGGLAQLQDITRELNAALDGRAGDVRELFPQLNELVTRLDDQSADIVSALDGLDRLSVEFAAQQDTIATALDQIPPALEVLVAQQQNISDAVIAFGRLSATVNSVLDQTGDNLEADINDLEPIVAALNRTGTKLIEALPALITFPFPITNMDKWLKGDYANLVINIDLTNQRLDTNFLTGTGLGGRLGGVEGLLGQTATDTAGRASDPVQGPLTTTTAAPSPDAPAPLNIPGLPPIPGLTAPLPGAGGAR